MQDPQDLQHKIQRSVSQTTIQCRRNRWTPKKDLNNSWQSIVVCGFCANVINPPRNEAEKDDFQGLIEVSSQQIITRTSHDQRCAPHPDVNIRKIACVVIAG